MGGKLTLAFLTLTGVCAESATKLYELGYIEPVKMPGNGALIAGFYALTEKGRNNLSKIIAAIPMPDKAEG